MNVRRKNWIASRALAFVAAGVLVAPILAGCGNGGGSGASMPPVDDSGRAMRYGNGGGNLGYQPMPQQRQGMSTGKKVAILAGAAALYYMYKKNKEKQQAGQLQNGEPIYYLSKNGRVYYRDQSGRAHWVTPPPQGIQVPYDEAQQYSQYQGYNNQSTGRDLIGMGSDNY